MRTTKEILDSLDIVYTVSEHYYYYGSPTKKCHTYIVDNCLGTQLIIADAIEDNDVIRYDIDFFDTGRSMHTGWYTTESEHELEALIKGFIG